MHLLCAYATIVVISFPLKEKMNQKSKKPSTYHIALTASLLKTTLQKRLVSAGLDVTPEQMAVLKLLSVQQECVSMKFISQHTFRDSSTVSRLIDTLEKKKLLERTSNSVDRRIKLICISEKGTVVFKQASAIAKEHVTQALQGVDTADRDRLIQVLIQIENNLK